MFFQKNYLEQGSTKTYLDLAKTVFLNTHFLWNNSAIHNINIKARVKYVIPSLF